MDGIIGQDRALGVIRAALEGERMHHAWVFHGPPGVGKATTAHALAELLLCHEPTAADDGAPTACGGCASCKLFEAEEAAHPDLHTIRKEQAASSEIGELRRKKQMNIPVDLLRERMIGGWIGSGEQRRYIQPLVAQKPVMGHGRVFVIDEAELLDATGQNALLKTLEEPPAGVYIILVTAHENRLLPTIRSRCQRVGFATLEEEQVARWLAEHPQGAELTDQQRRFAVRFARGSLGRAELAAGYRLDRWQEQLAPMVEQVAAGRPSAQMGATMAGLVEELAKGWVDDHRGASKDAANKAAVRYMLGLLGEMCRQGLQEAMQGSQSDDPAAAEAGAQPWLAGIDLIQQAERQLDANVGVALLLDNLAIQWATYAADT